MWHGYVDEAADVLRLVDQQLADDPGEQGVEEVRALQQWLSVLCPAFHQRMFGNVSLNVADEIAPAAIAAQPRLHAAAALSVVLRGGEPEPAVVGAAHVLEMSSLTPTLETIPLALTTLYYADRTEQLAQLLRGADERRHHAHLLRRHPVGGGADAGRDHQPDSDAEQDLGGHQVEA